jgi:hypothetical protein
VNWTSNPPFKLDEKKTTAEGAMLTATPANEYEKLVISVTDISVPSFARSVAETGFGNVRENDHVSPGALQVLVGAPLPQTPAPEMVAESARAPIAPRAASPSIIPKRQIYLRIISPFPAQSKRPKDAWPGPAAEEQSIRQSVLQIESTSFLFSNNLREPDKLVQAIRPAWRRSNLEMFYFVYVCAGGTLSATG